MKIPAHIGWPLLIVAFLLAGIGSTMSILYFAQSDGGAQVLESYHEGQAGLPDSSEQANQQPD